MSLLVNTPKGIYCEAADVFLDPVRRVPRALISHAHSDHAISGHKYYLCTTQTAPLLRYRLAGKLNIQEISYGKQVMIQGVKFSFHPAGHVYGSAQIRVEYKGEVWVYSGDYKLENDGVSEPFEAVPCDVFITESTFGLPTFRWKPQEVIFSEIHSWWKRNQAEGRCSILMGYPLGKSQHLLKHINQDVGPVYVHHDTEQMNQVIRRDGGHLPEARNLGRKWQDPDLRRALIIAPPNVQQNTWLSKLEPYGMAVASGWMGSKRQHPTLFGDQGFALSDHADYPGLIQAIRESKASRIKVNHGFSEHFSKSLQKLGFDAQPFT